MSMSSPSLLIIPQGATPAKRPSSPFLDSVLGISIPILDHGIVQVVDYLGGDDSAMVQAARVSYGDGTKTVREDRALIRYLLRNAHSTPFEMAVIKLHLNAPWFVVQQWYRHRTAHYSSFNQESGRYSILRDRFYIPDLARIAVQSQLNRQGSGDQLPEEKALEVQSRLREDAEHMYDRYEELLGPEYNVARELARIELPPNIYTEWYWEVDLHNLLHFLQLRLDPHAQWEIRQYADLIYEIVQQWMPWTAEAFEEYVLYATKLSRSAWKVIMQLMPANEGILNTLFDVAVQEVGMSASEARELRALITPSN